MILQAMKQALEALEMILPQNLYKEQFKAQLELRAAIEQMEKAEPATKVWRSSNKAAENGSSNTITDLLPMGTKLYTHPSQPPEGWQSNLMDAVRKHGSAMTNAEILSMLEAAPKEKA